MRQAARTDANHQEIVAALRRVGATVTDTSAVGRGFPDLTVGLGNRTYLLEIKDGSKPPSARQLTQEQKKWHMLWKGHKAVVCNVDEALAVVGMMRRVRVRVG